MADSDATRVLVQVVPVDDGRQIDWGASRVQQLTDRMDDIKGAISTASEAIADSLGALPTPQGWRLDEVTGSFGLSLTAEAGVIITKASVETTFEVTVKFTRSQATGS